MSIQLPERLAACVMRLVDLAVSWAGLLATGQGRPSLLLLDRSGLAVPG